MLASLGHAGEAGLVGSQLEQELWAPSAVAEVNTREMPKVMETEDIAATVASFAHASRLAAGAGMDGVEVNAGQHSLVRQFLSGLTNRRSDAYGADRTLFAREVLAAARLGLGPGGLLGLRLCVDELAPWAGITPEQAVPLALELAPLVDYMVLVACSILLGRGDEARRAHPARVQHCPRPRPVRSALARRGGPLVPVFPAGVDRRRRDGRGGESLPATPTKNRDDVGADRRPAPRRQAGGGGTGATTVRALQPDVPGARRP